MLKKNLSKYIDIFYILIILIIILFNSITFINLYLFYHKKTIDNTYQMYFDKIETLEKEIITLKESMNNEFLNLQYKNEKLQNNLDKKLKIPNEEINVRKEELKLKIPNEEITAIKEELKQKNSQIISNPPSTK